MTLKEIKGVLETGGFFYEEIPVLNPVLLKDYPSGRMPFPVLGLNKVKGVWWYRHYGQSAHKATLSGLAWVLRVIFGMTPEEFGRRYFVKGVK